MTNSDFAKMVMKCIEDAERAALGRVFVLKPETMIKLEKMSRNANCDCTVNFDAAFNALDICFRGYVFDSQVSSIRTAFSLADVFMIDADADGKVNIELRILNAANML